MSVGKIRMLDGLVSTHCTFVLLKSDLDPGGWGGGEMASTGLGTCIKNELT